MLVSPDKLRPLVREQARIVFNFARSFVETGPLLDVVRVGRNELIYPDGTGSMRVVSADGSLQFGHSVRAASLNFWTASRSWPQEVQRYWYVGLEARFLIRRSVRVDGIPG